MVQDIIRNSVEEESEEAKRAREKLRRLIQQRKWRNIKVDVDTYEVIGKIAVILGVPRYRAVDIAVYSFSILLQEYVKIPRDKAQESGLIECEEMHNVKYSFLSPPCLLYKVLMKYFRKRLMIKTLVDNLKKLYEVSKGESEESEEQ